MSKLNKLTLEEIKDAIKNSRSSAEACRILKLPDNGGTTSRFRRLALTHNIDISHWTGQLWSKDKTCLDDFRIKNLNKDEIFSEKSKVSAGWVRKTLRKNNLIEYKCHCGISDSWNGKPINLQLDHINGNRQDHRLENLRWICPNCHSQTETFCSKNRKSLKIATDEELIKSLNSSENIRQGLLKLNLANGGNYKRAKKLIAKHNIVFKRTIVDKDLLLDLKKINSELKGTRRVAAVKYNSCPICNKDKKISYNFCSQECSKISQRKVPQRPSKEELKKLLWEVSTAQIAKTYGVADHTIAKWAKAYDLDKPPRGYWAKQKSTIQSLSDSV
jgi:hypothetical protein